MEIYLQHGRKSRYEQLNNWGPDGPTLKEVAGIHQIYGGTMNIFFKSHEAMSEAQRLTGWPEGDDDNTLKMQWHEDLVLIQPPDAPEMFFGDWGINGKREFLRTFFDWVCRGMRCPPK